MLIPLLKVYQDVQDGLYQQYHNSRTQDTAAGTFGAHHLVTPSVPTGVVQRGTAHMWVAAYTLLMVMRTPTTLRRLRTVFVPSGV